MHDAVAQALESLELLGPAQVLLVRLRIGLTGGGRPGKLGPGRCLLAVGSRETEIAAIPLRLLVTIVAILTVATIVMTTGGATWDAINRQDKGAVLLGLQLLGMILGTLALRSLANVLIDLADLQLSRS